LCQGDCAGIYIGQTVATGAAVEFSSPVWAAWPTQGIDNAEVVRTPQTRFTGPGLISYFDPHWVQPMAFTGTRADFSADGQIDGADLGTMLAWWGDTSGYAARCDLNDDYVVDGADLGILLSLWGPCP
jgi:hypothetical protein